MVGRSEGDIPFWGPAYFQGHLVSFRECIWRKKNSKDLGTQVPTFSQALFRDQSARSLRSLIILVNSIHLDLSLPRWCYLPKGCLMTCDSQRGPDAPLVSAHG